MFAWGATSSIKKEGLASNIYKIKDVHKRYHMEVTINAANGINFSMVEANCSGGWAQWGRKTTTVLNILDTGMDDCDEGPGDGWGKRCRGSESP